MDRLAWDVESEEVKAERQKLEEERHKLGEERKCAVGFAASPVLPGENQAAFDQLVDRLRAQYRPDGVAQEDAVRTMAQAIWRKQRLGIFQRAAEARARFGRYFRFPNDPAGVTAILRETLQAFAADVERNVKLAQDSEQTEPGATPVQGCAKQPTGPPGAKQAELSGPFADLVALPKICAAMEEICTAYDEALGPRGEASVEMGDNVWNQIMLAMAGNLITPESYLAELRVIEQLDRVIERSHTRLMKMKSVSDGNSVSPKRVSSLTPTWAARRC